MGRSLSFLFRPSVTPMSAAFDFLHHKLLSINSLLSTTVLHPGPAKGLLTNFCEVLVSGSAFFLSFSDSLQVATYTAGFFFFFFGFPFSVPWGV